ncbi:hypothetical protein ACFLUD_03445 [Chloroflexota bacterium]
MGVEAVLRQSQPEVTPVKIITALETTRSENIKSLNHRNGNRDISAICYMVRQLLKAMLDTFRKVVMTLY